MSGVKFLTLNTVKMKKKVPPSSEPFDYELARQKVKEQLRSGKFLFGKEGAFAPLLQEMLNSILEGEMEGYLDEEERDAGNFKPVYQPMNKDQAEANLLELEEKWGKKYPVLIDSWRRNWDKLTTYFRYPDAILKLIYLATERIARKWTMPWHGWAVSASQLKIIFGDRMSADL